MKKTYNQFNIFALIILVGTVWNCSSSMEGLVREPVLEQVTFISDEICLDSYFWIIPANPCLVVKGIKENSTGKLEYQIIYRLSTWDVEFPIGLSLGLDNEYFNLYKVGTEYGSTLELISSLPSNLLPRIQSAGEIIVSYTNRRETRNSILSTRQRKKFIQYILEMQNNLRDEPKMKIKK